MIMNECSYSSIQPTRKENAYAYRDNTICSLWHYVYMLQDSVSSDANYVDILVCPEVHTAYVIDIYGTCFSYKHPCFDYDTRFLRENKEFADIIIGDMAPSIRHMFQDITCVVMFSQSSFDIQKSKARKQTDTTVLKSQLPFPSDICHLISHYCLPDWYAFDYELIMQHQSQHIQHARETEFEYIAL